MKRNRVTPWRYFGIGSTLALLSPAGHSQTQAETTSPSESNPAQVRPDFSSAAGTTALEEIVVTAQRRTENLQDVPIAVTALTATSLTASRVSNTEDLNLVVPGLNYTTVAGYVLPRIRGVGSTTSTGGNENEVATYVDGVYIASSTSSLLSFNNIQEVSVLKGPQGTLFGRNATGGVIQITTRDPVRSLVARLALPLETSERLEATCT